LEISSLTFSRPSASSTILEEENVDEVNVAATAGGVRVIPVLETCDPTVFAVVKFTAFVETVFGFAHTTSDNEKAGNVKGDADVFVSVL